MDAGYEAPDAFARAFRQRFGQSPSSFRKSPDWAAWLTVSGSLDNAKDKLMQILFETDDVTIRDVPPTSVAMIEHRGDRAMIPATRARFMAWSSAQGLSPETGRASFMVFRSERQPADPTAYSMDICAEFYAPIAENPEGVKAAIIPGGRYAVLRYPGNTNNLESAALYLYRDWLPASGEELRDFPLFCRRWLSPIAGMSAHEVATELYLALV